jgi:vacuolar-type H+-ATPase subunit D/Vma8
MKTMLNTYKRLLEREKQAALTQHFEDFVSQLGITDAQQSETLQKSFFALVEILDSNGTLQERVQLMAKSDFIWEVLKLKTSAKERELRKLTDDICNFIEGASQGAENEQQFIQNLLAKSLRDAAKTIESGDIRSSNAPHMAWIESLKIGLEALFKQKI